MSTTQLYKYATWFLLATNIGILTFFFFTKGPPPDRQDGLALHMKKTLNLKKEQMPVFTAITEQYKQKMKAINTQQKQLLRHYFTTLLDVPADRETLVQEIQQLEKQKIQTAYQHFQEVKNILTPEQSPEFERFMQETLDIMLSNPKKAPPPPKD